MFENVCLKSAAFFLCKTFTLNALLNSSLKNAFKNVLGKENIPIVVYPLHASISINLNNVNLLWLLNICQELGSGCVSVANAVPSDTRGPWFQFNHCQIFT